MNKHKQPNLTPRIEALIGPPSHAERASLFGRKSALRAAVSDRVADHNLPELLPPDEDVSLRNAAEYAARQVRDAARRLNMNRGGSTPGYNGPTNRGPRRSKQDS